MKLVTGGSCQDNCNCRTEKCSNRTPELPQSTTSDADLEKNQENTDHGGNTQKQLQYLKSYGSIRSATVRMDAG